MPAPTPVLVTEKQRATLLAMVKTGNRRCSIRAQVILHLARGASAKAVAKGLGLSVQSVSKWRGRWSRHGLPGLQDIPGRGRKASIAPLAEILTPEPPQVRRFRNTKEADRQPSLVTLQTIARKARVSVSTVSRSLNYRPGVGDATSTQIRALAKALHYHADPALSALVAYRGRVRRSADYGTIALLSGRGTREDKFPEYLRLQVQGMRETAQELGYHLEIFGITPDERTHQKVSRILHARGIRGVIIGSLPPNWPHLDLQWDRFSAVAIGHSLASPKLHRVLPNHYIATETIYREMRKLGYRKIGFCDRHGSEQNMNFMNLSVYLRCIFLDGQNSGASPPYLFEDEKSSDPLEWLRRYRFDAIICGWSDMILRRLEGTEFRVPHRLGVAEIALNSLQTNIAGMLHNYRALGSSAVRLLQTALLHNQRGVPDPDLRQSVYVDASWRKGKTVRQQAKRV